ncbi:MAG: choice-of-anchor tandem repeat GloVer-containing protein [Candidatus Sulfotelmatobacter sp.]
MATFYGTTEIGGPGTPCSFSPTPGTIFTLTAEGTLATLHDFDCTDGASPTGILQGADGNLYGTTASGGDGCVPAGCGTIFKITPSGTLTTLHFFDGTDGSAPVGLLQGSDGNFYGMAGGTFFKVTPSGTFTVLKSSCACGGALVEGSDGNFYGVTYSGGANSGGVAGGTVFKITPTGTLTTLYSFCSQTNCTDGWGPVGGLIQGSDGNFYGTTAYGGAGVCGTPSSGCGTIFNINPSGNLTTLYNFCSQANCADGANPESALLQASDRVFYGTTTQGGANNGGTFFSLSAGLNGATASSTSVNLSLSNIVAGSSGPVVMTATVLPVSGSGTPSGTIAFFNGSTYLGTSAVTAGVATYDYNPSSLSANTYPITAAYSGDSTFAGSNSPAQTLTVVVASVPNPDYQLSVNPSALNIMAGQSGKAVFTVTPENGFDTNVSFACSGLPPGATCTFDPANVTPSNSNPVTSTLTVSTTTASATMREPKPFSLWPIYTFLVPTAGLLFGKGTRRRRLIRGSRFLNGLLSC